MPCLGDPPSLGVTDGFGNFNLLLRTLLTCAYQLCKNEGFTYNSRSIFNCQIWVQSRQNLEIYGSNCPIQGGCMFQWFLKEYCIYGVELFTMYACMKELSAHLTRRYGRMRVTLDGTSALKFISNFWNFLTSMGDPSRGNRLIWKLYTSWAYSTHRCLPAL